MSTEPPCVPLIEVHEGKAPVVADEFGCIAQLILLDASTYPAIEQAMSDSSVQLRNGSAKYPIELPHLQRQVGGSFARMMIQDAEGRWYIFIPPVKCVDQRLIISNGSFSFVDDVLPSLVSSEMCPVSQFADFDYLVGLKSTVVECPDGTIQHYYKWVLVPKTNITP
jgi:hypothetical protein